MDLHIVDDVESVCTLLIEIADHYKLKAQAFPSPTAYLDYVESGDYIPPALAVISDVDMPKMSGFEMMGKVRSTHPLLRFVFVTGYPEIELQHGRACFYLAKPFSIAKLAGLFEALAQCANDGPNAENYGCSSKGDCSCFNIHDWCCPRAGAATDTPSKSVTLVGVQGRPHA